MKAINPEEIKKILKDILDYFADFCDKNGILYSLDGGTLLGAVRHRGFIPWDDDIDVCLLRGEYEKFKALIKKDNHPYYKIHCYDIDGYSFPYMKLSDERTLIIEGKGDRRKKIGVNIDIFPEDHVPDDVEKQKEDRIINHSLWRKLNSKTCRITGIRPFIRSYVKLRNTSAMDICKEIDHRANNPDYYGSCHIGDAIMSYYAMTRYDQEWLKEYTTLPFEGNDYKVFSEWDKILTNLYNDYMTPHPDGQRHTHDSKAYWK